MRPWLPGFSCMRPAGRDGGNNRCFDYGLRNGRATGCCVTLRSVTTVMIPALIRCSGRWSRHVMSLIWESPSGWIPILKSAGGMPKPVFTRTVLSRQFLLIIWRFRLSRRTDPPEDTCMAIRPGKRKPSRGYLYGHSARKEET